MSVRSVLGILRVAFSLVSTTVTSGAEIKCPHINVRKDKSTPLLATIAEVQKSHLLNVQDKCNQALILKQTSESFKVKEGWNHINTGTEQQFSKILICIVHSGSFPGPLACLRQTLHQPDGGAWAPPSP